LQPAAPPKTKTVQRAYTATQREKRGKKGRRFVSGGRNQPKKEGSVFFDLDDRSATTTARAWEGGKSCGQSKLDEEREVQLGKAPKRRTRKD